MRRAATSKQLLTYAALFSGYVVALHALPGPWRNWSKGHVVDWWTVTHIAWGILGARMGQSLPQHVVLATLNELVEAGARKYTPDLTWGSHESLANSITDVIANAAGWYIGCKTLSK